MRNLTIIILFFFSIISYSQTSIVLRNQIEKINKNVLAIDSICDVRGQGIAEGQITFKRKKHKTGGWEAYFTNDVQKDRPIRIQYSEVEFYKNEDLDLYYQNGVLIFAELSIENVGKKTKDSHKEKQRFYFENGKDIFYDGDIKSLEYVLTKEASTRKMIYK